jgi:hypothetical protein
MTVIEKINKKFNAYLMCNEVPDTMYLGYQEFTQLTLKMKEMEGLGLIKKAVKNIQPKFNGMSVFMVHAEQHISFGRI